MRGTPTCAGAVLTCDCDYHRTVRRIAMCRRLNPAATIALIDRETGHEVGRIAPEDGR